MFGIPIHPSSANDVMTLIDHVRDRSLDHHTTSVCLCACEFVYETTIQVR